jgi:SAM-dependent methyltransferase
MHETAIKPETPAAAGCPVTLVCPACGGGLRTRHDGVHCVACAAHYPVINGIPDLIVGERFDDDNDADCLCYEEAANADTTTNYWIPLFRRLWPQGGPRRRVLSVGCGTGVDVDLLQAHGFDSIGIDCGNRTAVWPRRQHVERLLLANGKHLPFEDGTFDAVYCGCVFPHVGVAGDSFEVTSHYLQDRQALAREMVRVLRPGGKVVVSSPNARFPLDIFHGRDSGALKPRVNRRGDRFLLTFQDYQALFVNAGCVGAHALPVAGYWGFIRSRHSVKGYLASLPVRFLFWWVSRPAFQFLRTSSLNPWIVVLAEKSPTT